MSFASEMEEQEQMIIDDYNSGQITEREMNRLLRELHEQMRDIEEQTANRSW
jgi:2,3-bisphosphoglycerate-independent phosphoglycerate mutase